MLIFHYNASPTNWDWESPKEELIVNIVLGLGVSQRKRKGKKALAIGRAHSVWLELSAVIQHCLVLSGEVLGSN